MYTQPAFLISETHIQFFSIYSLLGIEPKHIFKQQNFLRNTGRKQERIYQQIRDLFLCLALTRDSDEREQEKDFNFLFTTKYGKKIICCNIWFNNIIFPSFRCFFLLIFSVFPCNIKYLSGFTTSAILQLFNSPMNTS